MLIFPWFSHPVCCEGFSEVFTEGDKWKIKSETKYSRNFDYLVHVPTTKSRQTVSDVDKSWKMKKKVKQQVFEEFWFFGSRPDY